MIGRKANHQRRRRGVQSRPVWTAFCLLFLQTWSASATLPKSALLPKTTCAYLSCPSVQQLDMAWRKTQFGELFADPRMHAFADSVRQSLRIGTASEVPTAGLTWRQLLEISQGEVCWAIAPMESDQASFLLLLDASDQDAKQCLSELVEIYRRNGFSHSTTSLANTVVTEFASTDPRIWRGYVQQDGLFCVSNSRKWLEDVVRHEATDRLTSAPHYQAMQKGDREGTRHLSWFWDPFAYYSTVRHDATPALQVDMERLMSHGFDGMVVGGSLQLATPDYDLIHDFVLFHSRPLEKTARLLQLRPLSVLAIPDWIPAATSHVAVIGSNFPAVLRAYGSWFDLEYAAGEMGAFDDVLIDIRNEPGGPEVDVQRELVEQLVGPMVRVRCAADAWAGEPTLYACPIRDGLTVRGAVQRMLEGDPQVSRMLVDDHPVWLFRPADGETESQLGPDLSGWAIAVADSRLIIANEIELLRDVLGGDHHPDRFQNSFAEILRTVKKEEGVVGWSLSSAPEALMWMLDVMRDSQVEGDRSRFGSAFVRLLHSGSSGGPILDRIDFRVLPTAAEIKAYLQPGFVIAEMAEGMHQMHCFVPRRAPRAEAKRR